MYGSEKVKHDASRFESVYITSRLNLSYLKRIV